MHQYTPQLNVRSVVDLFPKCPRERSLFPLFDARAPLAALLPEALPIVAAGATPLSYNDLKALVVSVPVQRLDDVARSTWRSLDAGTITLDQANELTQLNLSCRSLPGAQKPKRQQRRHLQRQARKHEKVFGEGRLRPLRPDEKRRILAHARALMEPTEPGMHYGVITAKTYAVLQVLLYKFHNGRSGVCFPSLETIAKAAGCARSTVDLAIKALEAAGLLTWCNRLARIRKDGRTRVIRTSNAYRFIVPKLKNNEVSSKSSESEHRSGTIIQEIIVTVQWREIIKNVDYSTKDGNRSGDGAAGSSPRG